MEDIKDVKVFKFDGSQTCGNTKVNHPGAWDVDVIRCSLKEGKGVKVGDRVLVMDRYPAFYRVRNIFQHACGFYDREGKQWGPDYFAIRLDYEFRVIGTQLPSKKQEHVSGEVYPHTNFKIHPGFPKSKSHWDLSYGGS